MSPLLLSRAELVELLDPAALLASLREAFVAYSLERTQDGLRFPIPLPSGAASEGASGMVLAPGLVPGIPAYSVKVHAKFPGQKPAIRGFLLLFDLATGAPLAILESAYLTALRTALAGALGADALARSDAAAAAIIGGGTQGRAQLEALRRVRPIASVRVFDVAPEAADAFAADPVCAGLHVACARSVEEAIAGADVVVTATWAREPFLHAKHLEPGMHVTTLGPDEPGKCELSAAALRASRVVVDDRRLAVEMGALGGAGLGADAIHAELGEVLAGTRPGRSDASDLTVFASVGLAFQDLAAGWLAYERARERNLGRRVELA